MAERLNMAEGTLGPGLEDIPAGSPKGISNISARDRRSYVSALPAGEQAKAMKVFGLEIGGGSGTDPEWLTDSANQPSRFHEANRLVELLSRVDRSKLTSDQQADFDRLLTESTTAVNELVTVALTNGVLTYVRADIKRIYTEATSRPTPSVDSDPWYASSPTPKTTDERIRDIYAVLGDGRSSFYKETFWNYGYAELTAVFGTVDVVALRRDFEGVASYVAARTAAAMEKELKGRFLRPAADFGDNYLESIKADLENANAGRARDRQEDRKRATFQERLRYNTWRERFDFRWAENAEELRASVSDWLKKYEEGLPEEAPETVYEAAKAGRQNAISALKEALQRLGFSEKSPIGKELRATIEGHVALIGGVTLLETGEREGFEAFTKFLEDFAHNFNVHHDRIYLGNAKSAIIQDFLSENDGEISLGGPGTKEKPLSGDTEEHRESIAEKAIRYATTHELFIREQDFYVLRDGNYVYDQRGNRVRIDRYGWGGPIEELLLEDSRGKAKAGAAAKATIRTGVFKAIKSRLDEEDIYEYSTGRFVSLASLNPDERKDVIRDRISKKMGLSGYKALVARINALTDQAAKDVALWGWLKDYNEKRENQDHSLFFPSKWDEVRLSIDTPTKLVDRALSRDEFRAMVEEVEDPYKDLTDDQIRDQVQAEFLAEIRAEAPAASTEEIRQKFEVKKEAINKKISDILFNQESRNTEAEQAFNLNRKYQKFLGVDSRWGGQVVRVVQQDGTVVLKPVWTIARDILKAKIDKEENDIKAQVTDHINKLKAAGVSDAEIEKARIEKTRLLRRDSTFGATLALRDLGIAHDLPIWNYYYYNDYSLIQAFAPLVGYTHNDKVQIVDLLDRGRREMRAVYDYLADEYMDGTILIVRDEPNTEIDASGRPYSFHRETWERKRVINEGGESMIRDILESRFMTSTSGGVEWVDAISKISDLGIYDLLWEHGCQDFREFQGFIKRRDEVELRQQSFWNTRKWRDPISYAKRLRAAGVARSFLVGGEVGGKKVAGLLIEPFSGLFRYRDELVKPEGWIDSDIRNKLIQRSSNFKKDLQDIIERDENKQNLSVQELDKLVEVGIGILGPLLEYMNARRSVVTNRAGLAPTNWKLDNELIWQAYMKEMLKRKPIIATKGDLLPPELAKKLGREIAEGGEVIKADVGGEKLGDDELDYAIQGRSRLALKVMDGILRTSSYHILVAKDQRRFAGLGTETRARFDAERKKIVDEINKQMPTELQTKIDNRMAKLKAQNVNTANLEREIQRLKEQYINERLHKEFVGEWAIRYADITSLPKTT